jgi:Spx/MgsR family transcriptional regulator
LVNVYGVPTCDKIKKTKSLLEKNKIDYIFINVRNEPLQREKLMQAVHQLGLDVVLNRKGMLYRKSGLKDKNLPDDRLFNELIKEQGMIKRPLIEKNGSFYCGYNEPAVLNFVK